MLHLPTIRRRAARAADAHAEALIAARFAARYRTPGDGDGPAAVAVDSTDQVQGCAVCHRVPARQRIGTGVALFAVAIPTAGVPLTWRYLLLAYVVLGAAWLTFPVLLHALTGAFTPITRLLTTTRTDTGRDSGPNDTPPTAAGLATVTRLDLTARPDRPAPVDLPTAA